MADNKNSTQKPNAAPGLEKIIETVLPWVPFFGAIYLRLYPELPLPGEKKHTSHPEGKYPLLTHLWFGYQAIASAAVLSAGGIYNLLK